jgi:hypothetical protein
MVTVIHRHDADSARQPAVAPADVAQENSLLIKASAGCGIRQQQDDASRIAAEGFCLSRPFQHRVLLARVDR